MLRFDLKNHHRFLASLLIWPGCRKYRENLAVYSHLGESLLPCFSWSPFATFKVSVFSGFASILIAVAEKVRDVGCPINR